MSNFGDYHLGLLKQVFDSYQLMDKLNDKPGDLEIMKKELSKINGLIQVIIKKFELIDNSSDDFVGLIRASKHYIENYDFIREIDTLEKLYSADSNRLKNIRYTILTALNDKKLIKKIESIIIKSQ